MNSTYNFNPEEKRMQLAALLQDPTQPYKRYSGPMGAPKSGGGGMNDMIMKMIMQNRGAPVVEKSTQYDPNSQNFTPSNY
jgi:hypothetical protein